MNMKDVECFVKVYEQKNFSKAAEILYLTPQGVSKIIRRLENEFGVDFFTRNTNGGIHETEYGSFFYKKALEFTALNIETQKGIESIDLHSKGILRLVSSFGVLRLLSPEFLINFSKEYPDIKVDYMEYPDKYICQNLLEANYDLGFAPFLREEKGLHIQHLFSRELYFVTHKGSRFYDYDEVTLEEIIREPFVIENKNFCIHKIIVDALAKRKLSCKFYFETSGFSLCYKLCQQGKANTISMDFIFDDMATPELRKIPFKEPVRWDVGLMYKKDVPVSPLSSKFIIYTQKWCRQHDL